MNTIKDILVLVLISYKGNSNTYVISLPVEPDSAQNMLLDVFGNAEF